MQVVVSNEIIICDYDKELLSWCWNNLVLDNPEFHKKEKMGFSTAGIPRELNLFERNGNALILPFGCLQYIWSTYRNKCEFRRSIHELRQFDYHSNINLYDYQEKAVKAAVNAKNGIIVMPCGAGKTQTALEIIARIGGKALWLTHTKDLLNQSMLRAKSVYDLPNDAYGTITDGKVDIGNVITFATVQTMAKLDLQKLRDVWDIVIVDECHKAIGSPTKVMQFYKVLSNLACRYKYGITATPKRADGLERSMFVLLGEKIIEITREETAGTTCAVEVQMIDTDYCPDPYEVLSPDGTIDYVKLVSNMVHDEDRMMIILSYIENIPKDCPTIVLGNRVEFLNELNKLYSGKSVCLSSMKTSKAEKEARKNALRQLNDCELNCIFATYQLAKEGLDVPNLRYIVFATPEKDETTVTQAAGRVARKFAGKEKGIIVDFVDSFSLYMGYAVKRKNIYRKLGYHILT